MIDEKNLYRIAWEILEGHAIKEIPGFKVEQLADKIVDVLSKELADTIKLIDTNEQPPQDFKYRACLIKYIDHNIIYWLVVNAFHDGCFWVSDSGFPYRLEWVQKYAFLDKEKSLCQSLTDKLYTTVKLVQPYRQHSKAFLLELRGDKALVEFRHTAPWLNFTRWISVGDIDLSE